MMAALLVLGVLSLAAQVVIFGRLWKARDAASAPPAPAGPPCAHRWTAVVTVTAKPAPFESASGLSSHAWSTILELSQGRVTVLLACERCGALTERSVRGSEASAAGASSGELTECASTRMMMAKTQTGVR